MSHLSDAVVPLKKILGLSPLNPRQDLDSDVSMLAATIRARGLLHPLLVRQDSLYEPGHYEVLAGGRRWRALRSLCDAGVDDFGADKEIAIKIFEGSDAEAREAAIAESATQRPLHPLDEFQAFAALEEDGLDIAAIARDFALTERHVKQRLALARLSPRVRAAWRNGELSRDAAEAFTAGDWKQQEALLDCFEAEPWLRTGPYIIKRRLRGGAVDPDDALALFLTAEPERLSAYLEAGGLVFEDLFEQIPMLLDAPIAKRVAREHLMAIAEKTRRSEGWGEAQADDKYVGYPDFKEIELTPDEKSRVGVIDALLDEAEDNRPLIAELWEIAGRAVLRATPLKRRPGLAVCARLDGAGRVILERGIEREKRKNREGAAVGAPREKTGATSDARQKVPDADDSQQQAAAGAPAAPEERSKALQAAIDATTTAAFREITRRRGDIAIAIAVAAIGCAYGASGTGLRSACRAFGAAPKSPLLAEISDFFFIDAIMFCMKAKTYDLSVALFEAISWTLETDKAAPIAIDAIAALMCYRGAPLAEEFELQLDRKAFFEAAPKETTLGVVRGLIGEAEAGRCARMKKDKLAEYVARLSKEQRHLPAPFADWAAYPSEPAIIDEAIDAEPMAPSLAGAMRDAIEADRQDGKRGGKKRSQANVVPISEESGKIGEPSSAAARKTPSRAKKETIR